MLRYRPAAAGRLAWSTRRREKEVPGKRKDDDGPVTGVQAFAAELRAQREAVGLTQAQLAKLMGYSESVIASWRPAGPSPPRSTRPRPTPRCVRRARSAGSARPCSTA